MLHASKSKNLRTRLHAMRARLDEYASQIRDESWNGIEAESYVGLSNAPVDTTERASQQTEAAISIGLADNEAHLRTEIDAALARIDAKTYGLCERCNAVIAAKERLNAIPYARFCIRCERRVEQEA